MSEDTRRMLQPAAIGGVVFGVLSGIPVISLLNCACCAYAIGGGMLAAHLYFKDLPAVAQQSYGEGAMVGGIRDVRQWRGRPRKPPVSGDGSGPR